MIHRLGRALGFLSLAAALLTLASAGAAGATGGATSYVPEAAALATITNGSSAAPWNSSQGDLGATAYPSADLLPSYVPGGPTAGGEPNLAVYPGASSGTDGNSPYPSGTVGTPGPLDGYCGSGANAADAAGSPARQPAGTTLPFAPAYFPHIVRNADGSLTGYFDYRPKDADEAIVAARSTDGGRDWTYEGEALEQNPGYCANADTNDDGEGHPNVITAGGASRLYTLERAAGDNIGVGMLAHNVDPTAADPLAGVPSTEKTGVDPDDFASTGVEVPQTGGSPATIAFSTPIGSGPEALVAGEFVDLTQTPVPTAASVINCTAVGGDDQSVSGCTTTAPGGIAVAPGDLIEQVLATFASGGSVPPGPNTTTGDGGVASLSVNVTNPNNLDMAILNANAPYRAYVDGVAVYCSQSNAFPTNKIENCTTGPGGPALTVNTGDPLTSDPIVPAGAQQTTGLVAPDGIVGVLPSYPGAPAGSTILMYTEKVLNYYIVGFTGAKSTFSGSTPMSIAYTSFPNTANAGFAGNGTNGSAPYVFTLGDATTNTFVQETCTGLTTTSTGGTLTGCTGGTKNDTITKNSYLGAPGAALVPPATLGETGEGSATNAQKLFKNNEDLTVLRVAYTTNGVDFSSSGLANGGVISGTNSQTTPGGSYGDITNPAATTSPSNLNAYATPGAALATEMRFAGSAGSIITNPDGSYGLFLSGAWAADGDSDAFNQIFYSSSTDGENWTVPVSVVSTDYTFAASAAQDSALAAGEDEPLGISAYYSGRAYGPSVVQNPDGTLTMVFAGYRLPSPTAAAGTVLGTNSSARYTIGATDPDLYRNILTMTMTLTSSTSPKVATVTSVVSSYPSSAFGVPVTYTATVTVPAGSGIPTGKVSFTDGGSPISASCTNVSLSDSTPDIATCTTTPAVAGPHAIVAIYAGDTNYATSSGSTTQTVGKATTTTTVSSSASESTYGTPVTYTATVAVVPPGVGIPTGTVSFTDGGSPISASCTNVSLSASTPDIAACTTTPSGAGTHAIVATYSGDTNDAASSDSATQTVDKATLTVTPANVTEAFGQPTPAFTSTVTGFVNGDPASVVTGSAVCTTARTLASPAGTYPITCSTGTLSAANYSFAFAPGTFTVTYTETITGVVNGPFTVASGQSLELANGASVHGPLTVQNGGSLDIEGGSVSGPVSADKAAAVRICGATLGGPLQLENSTGPVVVGDGTSACPGAAVSGPVTVSGNSGGVTVVGDSIHGPLQVQGNSGGVTVADNTVSGPVNVTGNTGTVVDKPNSASGPANLQ